MQKGAKVGYSSMKKKVQLHCWKTPKPPKPGQLPVSVKKQNQTNTQPKTSILSNTTYDSQFKFQGLLEIRIILEGEGKNKEHLFSTDKYILYW